jgi:hypothetical protein
VLSVIFCVCFIFFSIQSMDQWYQSSLLFFVSLCMSPTRSEYRELGLELVSLEDDHSHQPKWPPMMGERRDDGVGYPIKMFLEESLT